MRINRFVAQATGLSRRAADQAIADQRVQLNGQPAAIGAEVSEDDSVTLDGKTLTVSSDTITIMLNKPAGYVVSRDGQGSQTVYDLLPLEFHNLKPIGRLDKDSSGLLLLTSDGELANRLTHPSYAKEKIYEITLDKPLAEADRQAIEQGVKVEDYTSQLQLEQFGNNSSWRVTMREGRNRQIRRTFAVLGYTVAKLHRTHLGKYELGALGPRDHKIVTPDSEL